MQGNLSAAIAKIKQDTELSKFISSINSIHKKLKNTPLLSKQGKLDEYGNRVMLDAIRLYYVYSAAPKQWKLLKLNPINFRLFICYFLFDFYDIKTPDKNNQIFVFLPLMLGICEAVLKDILIDPCALTYMTNLSYNKLLKATAKVNGFELLYETLKIWDMDAQILEQAQKLSECANKGKNEMHADFMLSKMLFGFEFSREIFSTTNLRYIFDFDDELNLGEVEKIKEKLGEANEDTL
ncbi:hypothetical protein LBC_10300 [Campylobacter sp. 19-13652]|nr:hypothetical protein LBC_10300 [Campylobacter sp. 19-13652]